MRGDAALSMEARSAFSAPIRQPQTRMSAATIYARAWKRLKWLHLDVPYHTFRSWSLGARRPGGFMAKALSDRLLE